MLPHIQNSTAGVNNQDPVYNNMFEVDFTIPNALVADFNADVAIMKEQVRSVDGLGTLDRGVEAGTQQFMGTSRSFLNSKPSETTHDLTIVMELNMRNGTDNWLYKLLKAWNRMSYDLTTGETFNKADYVADWFKIKQAARDGSVWREILYKNVMLPQGIEAFSTIDYTSSDIASATLHLRSDWALEHTI